MRVLALDTTTRAGSVALVEDGRILDERPGDGSRTHAERLPRELLVVLDEAGLTPADIDVFAVAAGPGSFTGIRIGIAAIQGLALATGRRVVATSVLDLLALAGAAGRPAGTLLGVWMDAHRGDVFSALFRVGAPAFELGHLIEVDPPRVERPDVVAADWASRFGAPAVVVGDGARLYTNGMGPAVEVMSVSTLAGILGRWAAQRAQEGESVHPAAVQPVYVRRPDAEIARERAAAVRASPASRGGTLA